MITQKNIIAVHCQQQYIKIINIELHYTLIGHIRSFKESNNTSVVGTTQVNAGLQNVYRFLNCYDQYIEYLIYPTDILFEQSYCQTITLFLNEACMRVEPAGFSLTGSYFTIYFLYMLYPCMLKGALHYQSLHILHAYTCLCCTSLKSVSTGYI